MNKIEQIQQQIDDLQEQVDSLTQERNELDWKDAHNIVEINGFSWILGPEAPEELDWYDAVEWCESIGGELPPRNILLECFMNEDIKQEFTTDGYWSSTELTDTDAWVQGFNLGNQLRNNKTTTHRVRAVRNVNE